MLFFVFSVSGGKHGKEPKTLDMKLYECVMTKFDTRLRIFNAPVYRNAIPTLERPWSPLYRHVMPAEVYPRLRPQIPALEDIAASHVPAYDTRPCPCCF